jgi:hypothetical protein
MFLFEGDLLNRLIKFVTVLYQVRAMKRVYMSVCPGISSKLKYYGIWYGDYTRPVIGLIQFSLQGSGDAVV